ncbi:heme oxygenase [Chryseobacterium piperi]|uniref:Heme oxygenase n=1 Tax=Chryseobacterium piperi TaxID=558152 RepID=A0A086BLZ2_9FLAO|nr:hypothetical protein [Chryseobacterium piperi]ASW75803.1 heme oxygenase [Chryseobacterium piperi]KFF29956.1 heme oxygenase [Chryseobacterium piperi]
MKTIQLYKFKDSVTKKIPLFKEDSSLNTLNDLMYTDLMDVEIVTEYIIDIGDDFVFEDLQNSELLIVCTLARETIEHYFVTAISDYDLI